MRPAGAATLTVLLIFSTARGTCRDAIAVADSQAIAGGDRCASGEGYLVRPLIFVPTDYQDYLADGRVAAFVKVAVEVIRSFYATNNAGRTFRLLPVDVVSARHDRAYYWRGPNPNFEYQVLWELQERGYPVHVDWDRFPSDRVVLVFAMGGGGWAGGRHYPVGGGFAMVGDAVLLAGMDLNCDRVREEAARKVCRESWLPSGHIYGFGVGAMAHELGHAFNLPHPPPGSPDWPRTVMGEHWNYPKTGLSDSDRSILATSCFFRERERR